MSEKAKDDWFTLGRHEQWSGRPIEALFYFKRTIAKHPARGDARFHLGEVLWQLGRVEQAKAAWRDATTSSPKHLPSWLAYTEACLNTGDAEGAKAGAVGALALAPGDARATTFLQLADAALGDADVDWTAIADAVRADGNLVFAPARGRLIASALDRAPDAPGQREFVDLLASTPSTMPLELLASLVASAARPAASPAVVGSVDAVFAEALARKASPVEADACRQLACAARKLGRLDASRVLAATYARLCVAEYLRQVPLLWPRRTAGAALRIAVPAAPGMRAEVVAALAAIAGRDHEITLVALTLAADAEAFAGSLPFTVSAVVAAGAVPDPAASRLLVARDPDVLIDAVGLDAATGPWLAQRPGRALWTLADIPPPLVDRSVDPTVAALAAALASIPRTTEATLTTPAIEEHWALGLRAHQGGDADAARAAYSAVIDDQPDYAPARHFRARLEWDAGEHDAAAGDLAVALERAPGYADARVDASRLALERDAVGIAIRIVDEGLALDPAHTGLLRALGHARLRFGDGRGAAEAFTRAAMLDPLDAETQYNLGVARQLAGDTDAAMQSYRHAVAFDPLLVDAPFNLGVLFQQQGRRKTAMRMYRHVIEIDRSRDAAWKNLGEMLREDGDLEGWAANFRQFEAACPDSLLLAVQALEVCQYRGDFQKLDRYLDGLRQERYRASSETALVDALEELLYLLLFFDVPPAVMHRFARTYDQASRRVYGVPRARAAARKPGKLRIGYLSADLRDHVMGKMMWQAVRHHDRQRFDLYFYALSGERDRWTTRFEEVAAGWRDVSKLTEREAAHLIDADDLDLLVDLQTHTKGAKPGILALKPARVQITHVASAGTLGLSAIDYKLTDAFVDMPEAQDEQIEPLLAMGGCVYPYRAVEASKVPELSRVELGIPQDAFVIGAFVAPLKLSRRCLALWKEVADRIPRARFALSPLRPELRGEFERVMVAAGIARDRLLFIPQGGDDAKNQARYRVVDVVLDPMPYGNVNGTIEPLAMGVPVVTLVGKRHGERTTWSVLSNLGVTSTVAHTGRDYVDLVVRLAEDDAFMRETRAAIHERLPSSMLTDMRAYARHLEAAYLVAIGQKTPEALDAATASDPR